MTRTELQREYERICRDWISNEIRSAEDLDVLLHNYRILFAYNSNVIENPQTTIHDTREIFENGKVINYTGDLRTLFEIENQKICYDYLKDYIIRREPLSPELICSIHKKLMAKCYDESRYQKGERPGTFKIHDYITGDGVGALPEDVPGEISELCREVNDFDGSGADVLTAGAYLHLVFESIHPFADGNGRVGRTLMNYYFMTHDHPPLIIFEDSKDTYYAALAVFDKTGKLDGFKLFLREQTVRTWKRENMRRKNLNAYL